METVRVELRKLQILNDRINQTIDALTQLRQSVHAFQPYGLQHSNVGFGVPQMTSFGAPFGMQPQIGIGPQAWAGAPVYGAGNPWLGQTGLSHTSAYPTASPWAGQAGFGADPWSGRIAQGGIAQGGIAQSGIAGPSAVGY